MNEIVLSDVLWFEPYLGKFFPEEYFGKKGYLFTNEYNGWDRESFRIYVQNYTGKKSISEAIDQLKTWKENIVQGKTIEGNTPPKEILEKAKEVERSTNKLTAEQQKKESLLESQKYAEKLQQIEAQKAAQKPPEVEQVIIQKTVDDTNVSLGQGLPTVPIRTAISWSTPYMNQSQATAGELFINGVRSDILDEKFRSFQGFQTDRQKEITELLSNLGNYEKAFPGYTPLSTKDITILSGADSGINQSQLALMMRPLEEGGMSLLPKGSPLGGIFNRIGQQLFGKAASGVVNKALTNAAGSAAVGTAVRTTASTLVSSAGGPAGLLFFAAQYGKQIAGKILDWISQNGDVFIGILGVTSGFAIIGLGGPALAGFVPMSLGGMSLIGSATGGIKGIGKGVSGFGNKVLVGFTTVFFPSIGVPFLITAFTLPVAIAIIIFIINSGAYIVPPSPSLVTGNAESPYIGVEKSVDKECINAAGCAGFGKVTYTIRIWAKKGALSNVTITNKYTVIGKGNLIINPPIPDEIKNQPLTISPSQEINFSYELDIDKTYDDSIIVDTITVIADAEGKKGETASDDATIIVGNPPISCPVIGGRTSVGSYNASSNTGHGSNSYWRAMGGTAYRYPLPQVSSCNNPGSCPYYGYAQDISSRSSSDVVAPTILGENLTWKYNGVTFANGGGTAGRSYGYTDTTGKYTILLTHVQNANTSGVIKSGQKIAKLYPQAGNTHLHLEMQINGAYVKPENYFCK